MNTRLTIRHVLKEKGNDMLWIAPHATAYEALELMAEKNVGALLVIENKRLVGIFSERDYARKVILYGKSSKTTTVRELMTSTVITIDPENTVSDCMEIMTANHIRHIPVVEDGRLIGLVTLGDVVKAVIASQQAMIRDLENYISGGDYLRQPIYS